MIKIITFKTPYDTKYIDYCSIVSEHCALHSVKIPKKKNTPTYSIAYFPFVFLEAFT